MKTFEQRFKGGMWHLRIVGDDKPPEYIGAFVTRREFFKKAMELRLHRSDIDPVKYPVLDLP